jgi:hypothetical protein
MSQLHSNSSVRPVAYFSPCPIDWLWLYRLALGKPALLAGDTGLGKSLVALDLCARLSKGVLFPDGAPGPGPCNVLILNGEDTVRDTTLPRLQSLGADLERVFVWNPDDPAFGDLPRFPSEMARLDQVLAQTQARLVVIDPIKDFLDRGINANSDASVRRVISPLARLGELHRCAVKLILHLNKAGNRQALYRASGSVAWVAGCRSAWLVARDPQDSARCVLAQLKNNLAARQPSLAYAVQAPNSAQAAVTWLGPSSLSADQLAGSAGLRPLLPTPRDRAKEFLSQVLAAGPRTSRDIWPLAEEQNLAEATLHRARQELGIRNVRVWLDGRLVSYWLLKGQELPASVPPEAVPPDLEPWLAPLREKYPPPTPLDDP